MNLPLRILLYHYIFMHFNRKTEHFYIIFLCKITQNTKIHAVYLFCAAKSVRIKSDEIINIGELCGDGIVPCGIPDHISCSHQPEAAKSPPLGRSFRMYCIAMHLYASHVRMSVYFKSCDHMRHAA